ncbi:hypothetical protein DFH06DRAFT_1415212 [Mycena polygramma]|nr:hypothetical protein DFH06DRAFT_1415212 [Mycena polygramma]
MNAGTVLRLSDGWTLALTDIVSPEQDVAPDARSSLVPKTRSPEARIVAHARLEAEHSHPNMLRHLPHIYHDEEFDDIPDSHRFILEHLGMEDEDEGILRIMVQEELQPIIELADADELAQASKGHLNVGYRWLYETPKILHRDISVTNLTFRKIQGKVYEVLNDFDLAEFYDPAERPPSSKQRTGSKPYMAIDLLVPDPPQHQYRHDLESFLYVIVFLTCQIPKSKLADWHTLGMDPLRNSKIAAIAEYWGFPLQKTEFAKIRGWIFSPYTTVPGRPPEA